MKALAELAIQVYSLASDRDSPCDGHELCGGTRADQVVDKSRQAISCQVRIDSAQYTHALGIELTVVLHDFDSIRTFDSL